MKQQDATHLFDRVRVRLRRVSGADDVLGIHTVEMRARIFDDTVVAAFDRPIAFNRDDRMRVDTRGNRRCGHRLEDRVVWRHAEQATRSEIARVDLEVAGIAREVGTDLEDAHWKGKEPPQELGDRIFGKIAAAVRRGDEDDTTHIGHWFDEYGAAQKFASFRRQV